ncbi:MAG: hypothetical protein IJW28_00770 [Clostridia bacterium]|nr:hypothetical protein [Clostridia bacterium]
MQKIIINNDLYNISNRIKLIDKDYFIVYNFQNNKFEIHNYKNARNTYSLTIPYSVLDNRTIDYVQKTHISNIDKILNEMENNNQKLLLSSKNKMKDMITYKAQDIYKYALSSTKEFSVNSSYKNKWF